MPAGRCRSKNPSRCRSPRCPGRSGGMGRFSAPTGSIPSHREVLQTEKVASQAFINDLSAEQRSVLFDYTNQSYTDLNESLRRGAPLTPSNQRMVQHLDSLFDKATHSKPRLLLRSIRPPEDHSSVDRWVDETFPVGRTVKFTAYGSTTVSKTSLVAMLRQRPKTPERFTWTTKEEWEAETDAAVARNVVLELVTKEGVSVSTISHMPQETEVLLPRGQSYAVHSVDKHTYTSAEDILTGEQREERHYPVTRIRLVDTSLLEV